MGQTLMSPTQSR